MDGAIKVDAKFWENLCDAPDGVADAGGYRSAGSFGGRVTKRADGPAGPGGTPEFSQELLTLVGNPLLPTEVGSGLCSG